MDEEKPALTRKMRRALEKRACREHLADLRAAHGAPPLNVAVKETSVPKWLRPAPDLSLMSSPAQMCTEKNL